MQSHFERRAQRLDTTLPSVRHLQDLIRHATPVMVQLMTGQQIEGTIRWLDSQFIALQPAADRPFVLVNLAAISLLRALG
jgi:host factor-I protein